MGLSRVQNSMSRRYPRQDKIARRRPATGTSIARRDGNVDFQALRHVPALVRSGDGEDIDRKLTQLLSLAPPSAGVLSEKKWKGKRVSAVRPRLSLVKGG